MAIEGSIERIKTLLGIEDELQDKALKIIIENVTSHLSSMIKKDVPEKLNFVIEEIAIRRFNRLGTEGMKAESVEGHKIDFYDLEKDFVPYLDIIDQYVDDPDEPKRGKVLFF